MDEQHYKLAIVFPCKHDEEKERVRKRDRKREKETKRDTRTEREKETERERERKAGKELRNDDIPGRKLLCIH